MKYCDAEYTRRGHKGTQAPPLDDVLLPVIFYCVQHRIHTIENRSWGLFYSRKICRNFGWGLGYRINKIGLNPPNPSSSLKPWLGSSVQRLPSINSL